MQKKKSVEMQTLCRRHKTGTKDFYHQHAKVVMKAENVVEAEAIGDGIKCMARRTEEETMWHLKSRNKCVPSNLTCDQTAA